ncbi:MAG: DUF3800 domain-containing protein [Bacteroidetes bacterium]|nr:MAG: DUF3800 domain-containing protein [Bacteroidota bacterium]
MTNVYLDDSGDLGFKFEKPFRKGGSSRFLTIACVIVEEEKAKNELKRLVKKFYEKYNFKQEQEVKGTELTTYHKEFIQKEMVKLLSKFPVTQILTITVNKQNVRERLSKEPNKLYNRMIMNLLVEKIKKYKEVSLIRDNKSVKVESGKSLVDLLEDKLLFDLKSDVYIKDIPSDSKQVRNLVLVDWFVHMIWKEYEDQVVLLSEEIRSKIIRTELFF